MLPYLLLSLACVLGGEAGCTTNVYQEGCQGGKGTAGQLSELRQLVMSLKQAQAKGQKRLEDQMQTISSTSGCTKPKQPRNCKEVLDKGYTESGVYTIQTFGDQPGLIDVYCDQKTDGGGWLIFQRRQDGKVDFYQTWTDYANGFGNITSEFWLGNVLLHQLTDSKPMELRIDMEDFNNTWAFAQYKEFSIGHERDNFRLMAQNYSGNQGNSLEYHNGKIFSTWDKDNDVWKNNCAKSYHGAWWYGECHSSNLNGRYLGGPHASYADGVNWKTWHGYHYSLKYTEMKLRPV